MSEVPNLSTEFNSGVAAHSPGPWILDWNRAGGGQHEDFPELHYVGISSANQNEPLAFTATGWWRKPDAYLVAAAPDLLAALKELLDSTLTQMPPFEAGKDAQDAWADRRAKARNDATAAIAKAEGQL